MNKCLNANCSSIAKLKNLCRKHYRQLPHIREQELAYRERYLRTLGHKKRVMKWNASDKGKNAINKYQKTARGRYAFSTNRAKRQNKEFSISFNDYEHLMDKPCYYCNTSLNGEYGVGLDRIDNSKGYSLENVLPCCGNCNKIKGANITVNEMLVIAKLLKEMRNENGKEETK